MIFNIPQLSWHLETLIIEPLTGIDIYVIPPKLKQKNYSIALLRFWFIYHFLLAENPNRKLLHICEIGTGHGRQVNFINQAVRRGYPEVSFIKWDTFGENINKPICKLDGNSNIVEKSVAEEGCTIKQPTDYDVIICSAISGREQDIEGKISRLIDCLNENGILIGICEFSRDSVYADFTLDTIRGIAKKNNLAIDFLSGGYFKRNGGLIPLHKKRWFRFNLLLGAIFPSQASELYWVFRK